MVQCTADVLHYNLLTVCWNPSFEFLMILSLIRNRFVLPILSVKNAFLSPTKTVNNTMKRGGGDFEFKKLQHYRSRPL